jgi:hypothetical protein
MYEQSGGQWGDQKMAGNGTTIRKGQARPSSGRGGREQGVPRLRPGRLVHVSSRAVGLSAVALVLVVASSACGTGSIGGKGPAGTALTPRQALLAAETNAKKLTSATETLTIKTSGVLGSTTTGTIQFRRTPTPEFSENLIAGVAGKSVQVKVILTGTALYLHESALAREFGKPWLEIRLSALDKARLAAFAQIVQNLQSDNFLNVTQMFAAVKNVRSIGKRTVEGVPTTEYGGSFRAGELSRALPPSLRKALATSLRMLGNSAVTFYIWVDGQGYPRKTFDVATVNGVTINTTLNITAINQPVQITPPPASQTVSPPGI